MSDSNWRIEILRAKVQGDLDPVSTDVYEDNEIYIDKHTTSFSWSHLTTNPYSQATVNVLVPLRDLTDFGFGHYDERRDVLELHASGYLRIIEVTGNGEIERFYGPITGLRAGFKVDKTLGSRQTVPLTFTASTWLTPLMRGFVVSGKTSIDIGTSVIPYKRWKKIAEAVFDSAKRGGLTKALSRAWTSLAEALVGGTVLSGKEYTEARDRAGHKILRSVDVYGRNLSQLQPPPITGTLWGVLQNTFQASPLVEMFPAYIYDALKGETKRHLVHRMRPYTPRIAESEVFYLNSVSGLQGQEMDKNVSFITEANLASTINEKNKGPYETPYVSSYDLSYSDARNNYIEVTSPYTGATPLAGVSCDPLYHKGDIEVYGLFRVSVPYPYIRSKDDSEAKIREEMNDLAKYASLVYSFDHKYASGTLVTKYVDGNTLSHGDWVRWRSHGPEKHFYDGYITKATHSFTVNEHGVLEGSSTYSVERVEAIVTKRPTVQVTVGEDR